MNITNNLQMINEMLQPIAHVVLALLFLHLKYKFEGFKKQSELEIKVLAIVLSTLNQFPNASKYIIGSEVRKLINKSMPKNQQREAELIVNKHWDIL